MFLFELGACGARLPQDIAPRAGRDVAGGDEQMIGQAVEVGEQLRVERLAFVQGDRGTLGAADDRAGEMERGNGQRTRSAG